MPEKIVPANTPLFLLWAIKNQCVLKRNLESLSENQPDLLPLERAFRPLRELTIAESENRIVGDICFLLPRSTPPPELEQIKAFSISEMVEAFGGENFLTDCCTPCPDNIFDPRPMEQSVAAENEKKPSRLAGCYGYLQSEYSEHKGEPLFERWQKMLDSNPESLAAPAGYQLHQIWHVKSPDQPRILSPQSMEILRALLLATLPDFSTPDLTNLLKALDKGLATPPAGQDDSRQIQIHVVPEAEISGNHWIVPEHCSNCISAIESWSGQCPICQTRNPPNPKRKRYLKGDRPFWPLVRFLGPQKAKSLAEEYFVKN